MSSPRTRLPGVVYPPPELGADYAASGMLPQAALVEAFLATMRARGEATAISTLAATMSYAELDRQSERVAAGLLAIGLKPLDSVLFQMPNGPELMLYFVACLRAGLIPVCTLLAHRENEIVQIGRQLGARAHLVPAQHGKFDYLGFAAKCRGEVPSLAFTLTTDAATDAAAAAAAGAAGAAADAMSTLATEPVSSTAPPATYTAAALARLGDAAPARAALAGVEHDPWQVAIYQLSGGTTGTPKVIPRFQNDYLCNLQCTVDRLGFRADDRMLVFTPMMHNAPFLCAWGSALLVGAETVAIDGVDPKQMIETILLRRPTWSMVSELMLARTRGLPGAQQLWSSFRGLLVARAAQVVEEQTGVQAFPFFGMTEGVIFFAGPDSPQEVRYGTLGHPISPADRFKIVVPGEETELPDGEVGEMVIRGPYTLHGYYDAAERNRQAFTSDGYYRTGDLMSAVEIDGRRCVRFHGRSKDVVDRGGEKISCEELELHLIQHPHVGAVAIVPMPDPQYGERACAFIVPSPPNHALTLDDLRRHLAGIGVAKFKWPERLELVDGLPMTASGKVSKAPLRDAIRARIAAERAQADSGASRPA
ncbi:MAG: AMP-binding protein [Burkholderiaceae bacterium]